MNADDPDKETFNRQQTHWENVYTKNQSMFGDDPSIPACKAAEIFKKENMTRVLELGAGQGRDTLFFAQNGFEVYSLDYSRPGVESIKRKARESGLINCVKAVQHDVRKPLPFEDESFDACFSHMLYCMPLTTSELESVSKEIRRVLRPGGINIFTTRHTGDPQYRTGIYRGEDMWEISGGFIVHFLSREKINQLSKGYQIIDIEEFEEGKIPGINKSRKLFKVAMRKKD